MLLPIQPDTKHRSPEAPVAVNHVVSVGPAAPFNSVVWWTYSTTKISLSASPSARDVVPGSPQALFSNNVTWESDRSVEQENMSVWDRDAQPSVNVSVASSSTTAAHSDLPAGPVEIRIFQSLLRRNSSTHELQRLQFARVHLVHFAQLHLLHLCLSTRSFDD